MSVSNSTSPTANNLWSIILSGGDGERMRPFIEQWLGRHIPKQYCTFVGSRSMLQHTLDRADRLTPENHKVTVMAQSHRSILGHKGHLCSKGRILFQPENRGTAAGIFLPLTHIRSMNKDATVIVYPSDHFIFPEGLLLNKVAAAVRATEHWNDRIFLFGAMPTRMEADYGWIEKGNRMGWASGTELHSVRAFEEKPSSRLRWSNLAGGYLWNTMIMVAKLNTLWSVGWQCFPALMERFSVLSDAINTLREGAILEAIYQDMPNLNFSSELLEQAVEQLGVLELQNVLWEDWGRPERIVDTLKSIGKDPSFPVDNLVSLGPMLHYNRHDVNIGHSVV